MDFRFNPYTPVKPSSVWQTVCCRKMRCNWDTVDEKPTTVCLTSFSANRSPYRVSREESCFVGQLIFVAILLKISSPLCPISRKHYTRHRKTLNRKNFLNPPIKSKMPQVPIKPRPSLHVRIQESNYTPLGTPTFRAQGLGFYSGLGFRV